MINGSSRRDLLLNSQNFCRSIPAGAENPSLSRLCYRRLWGSRNRRALILGWAYYLDAFSSYPLRTWLPSVYRGHDNWYTRASLRDSAQIVTPFRAGRNLPDKEFRYLRTVIVTAAVHRGFGRRLPCHQVTNFLDLPALGRRQPPYMVLRLCGDLCFW
ncbi:Cell wall-associated hydrolase [Quillaja saponaria]|uniref:Cell wall-associated hydrolase n=1 Tax=Quillaja saponaria TaxID=32244 RepID=A0AAD7KK84_QUISA|nr:Cell wall-associated hydrolase [Quillaja saponaria]